jgi:hypothetical protein
MALEGNLTDIHAADLIQLNCQSGARARLNVQRADAEIILYFDGGEVVHAQAGGVQGAEAVYELLTWETGTFAVEPNVESPARSIGIPWSALIMEGMKRLDERQQERKERTESMTTRQEVEEMAETKSRGELLEEALRNIVEHSTDIQGVAVISMDGLIISAVLPSKMEQMRVGAVAAGILSLSGRSVGQLGRGDLQQTLVQGTDGNVIITHAGKNAALVALTGSNINLGMAFLETQEGVQTVTDILGQRS